MVLSSLLPHMYLAAPLRMVMMPTTPTPPLEENAQVKETLVGMVEAEVRAGGFPPDQSIQVEYLAVVDHLVEKVALAHLEQAVFYMVLQDWMFYWVVQEVDWAT